MLKHFVLLNGFHLPITSNRFSIAKCPINFQTWPCKTSTYVDWLYTVVKSQGEYWKKWGIYDLILLSCQDIPTNTA